MASSFDVPKRLHAAQHGAGGPDPITPADIGAMGEAEMEAAAQAAAAPAVAAAQSAQADAADSAASSAASAILAGQAQAAALEIPDANTAAMIGNDATLTAAAFDARLPEFLANAYGAKPSATWQVNRDAFQAAIDAAHAAGGGTVVARPGTYDVKGLFHRSHVTVNLSGVTLRHPDGVAPDLIRSAVSTTTGGIAWNSTTLTVADATGIEPGAVIAIRAAGGKSPTQTTTLTTAVDATATTLEIADATGWGNFTGWAQIDSEFIEYAGVTGATLTGVTRGAFGSAPASHATGATIGYALRHYSTVTAVSGTTVTIADPAPASVSSAAVTTGAVHIRLDHGTLDGNRVTGGAPAEVHPVKWELVRWGSSDDVTIRDGEAGMMLRHGCTDCTIARPTVIDCSVVENSFGGGLWLFRGNVRCHYVNPTVVGQVWAGIYFDDRTTSASEWDARNVDCTAENVAVHLARLSINVGIANVGGLRCHVKGGTITGARTAFTCTENSQGAYPTPQPTSDNRFSDLTIANVYQPGIIKGTNTQLDNVRYDETTTANRTWNDTGTNTHYAGTGAIGKIKNLAPDGTYNAPSIAFQTEPGMGFYHPSAGLMDFMISGGTRVVRFYSGGLAMGEGRDIVAGTSTGTRFGTASVQKLGFFGATPVVRPNGFTTTSGLTVEQLEAQVNALKVALRDLGILGG